VTANAVLASPADRVKASLRSSLMIPRVALVDPELTLSCPPPVTAASGLDALTQCLEPLVSAQANPLTDSLSAAGLRNAAAGLRAAYADGDDINARTSMAICSLLGGMALANAKLGAIHGLAGVIGGTADVPHGVACAALLVPVIEANVRALQANQPGHPALGRYTLAAQLLTGRDSATIEDGVSWIRETLTLLQIPGLAVFGITPEHADAVAAQAIKSSSMRGNPVPLSTSDLRDVLLRAL
jgi:alcohol dehydrogenase class IV